MNKLTFYFLLVLIFFGILYTLWEKKPESQGVLLWEQGRQEKAIEVWENDLSQPGKHDRLYYRKLIESLLYRGDFAAAETWCKKALTVFPGCVNFYFYLSLTEFYQGRFDESLKLSETVLDQDKNYPDIHLLRGLDLEKEEQDRSSQERIHQ